MRITRNGPTPLAAGIAVSLLAICVAFLAAETSPAFPQNQPWTSGRVAWELRIPSDLPAPVQRAAIDPVLRTVHLATLVNLYAVQRGVARPVAKRPSPDAQVALAPGGSVYAWLLPIEGLAPLWDIHLRSFSDDSQVRLQSEEAPHGFGGLFLGFGGRLIATVTAIDDWRGIRGRYRFTFWSRDGRALKTIIRPTRESGIVAADGTSLLLLGQKEATAYSPDGELLWRLPGEYRKGAIAKDGGLALLNPSPREEIDQVYVFTGSGRAAVLDMPTPVHHLLLAPDGTAAVVGGDRGRYFFLDPTGSRFEEGTRLPFDADLFLTDLGLVDRETLAVGVLLREGKPPQHGWRRGGLAVVTREGKVLFREEYPVREPLSSRPAVDVTFGVPTVIGFTLDTTVRIELGR